MISVYNAIILLRDMIILFPVVNTDGESLDI